MFFWAREIIDDRTDVKSDDSIGHIRHSHSEKSVEIRYPNEQLTGERHSSACQ